MRTDRSRGPVWTMLTWRAGVSGLVPIEVRAFAFFFLEFLFWLLLVSVWYRFARSQSKFTGSSLFFGFGGCQLRYAPKASTVGSCGGSTFRIARQSMEHAPALLTYVAMKMN